MSVETLLLNNKQLEKNNKNNKDKKENKIFIPQIYESKHLDQVSIELFSPKRCENLFFWNCGGKSQKASFNFVIELW